MKKMRGGYVSSQGRILRISSPGIPTTEARPGERYSEKFGLYTSDSDCRLARIQWHRFDAGSSLHPLIRTVPHPAFKVSDRALAITGCNVLLGPHEPIAGFHVAIIEDGGMPVELIETSLTDEEVWGLATREEYNPVDLR